MQGYPVANMTDATSYVSLCGTALGVTSRVPQIMRVVQRESGADLSSRALAMNITANACFLVYSAAHYQWPIALNNVAVICLDGTLLALKRRFSGMKKRSSETDLTLLDTTAAGSPVYD